ncbi:prostate and testis expressed protein 13-like isoform X2 [Acomys russatus]|uniref:prostate and testis expressed protein 13-like isoform X2 n=1 Tax=Acomys russatus TaxID=60746 RepID=UPI0021E2282D|nr:prostate and testis expressed protein 13-like isoform X2 [Acomys russatus]
MFRMLLLSVFILLLIDTVIKHCNLCTHYDGFTCRSGMKTCWKFGLLVNNKSCTTENFYFYDRFTGIYLFRHTKLSCKPCARGMYQLYHDLLRETFCCTNKDYCNDGTANLDISQIIVEDMREKKELND